MKKYQLRESVQPDHLDQHTESKLPATAFATFRVSSEAPVHVQSGSSLKSGVAVQRAPAEGALSIPSGAFTRSGESGDSKIHWPGGNSGVTLGFGYDLGSCTEASSQKDLLDAGMSKPQVEKVIKGAGLKGKKAQAFVTRERENIGNISESVRENLFTLI